MQLASKERHKIILMKLALKFLQRPLKRFSYFKYIYFRFAFKVLIVYNSKNIDVLSFYYKLQFKSRAMEILK